MRSRVAFCHGHYLLLLVLILFLLDLISCCSQHLLQPDKLTAPIVNLARMLSFPGDGKERMSMGYNTLANIRSPVPSALEPYCLEIDMLLLYLVNLAPDDLPPFSCLALTPPTSSIQVTSPQGSHLAPLPIHSQTCLDAGHLVCSMLL